MWKLKFFLIVWKFLRSFYHPRLVMWAEKIDQSCLKQLDEITFFKTTCSKFYKEVVHRKNWNFTICLNFGYRKSYIVKFNILMGFLRGRFCCVRLKILKWKANMSNEGVIFGKGFFLDFLQLPFHFPEKSPQITGSDYL